MAENPSALRQARHTLFPEQTLEDVVRSFRDFQEGRLKTGIGASTLGLLERGGHTKHLIGQMHDLAEYYAHVAQSVHGLPAKDYSVTVLFPHVFGEQSR